MAAFFEMASTLGVSRDNVDDIIGKTCILRDGAWTAEQIQSLLAR
jgi:hypothetical protein